VYEERTFQALDWVIAEAGWRGLRLLLNLTNYWKVRHDRDWTSSTSAIDGHTPEMHCLPMQDYGGMRQYVQWAYQARGQQVGVVA
jgi:hypothetical protein